MMRSHRMGPRLEGLCLALSHMAAVVCYRMGFPLTLSHRGLALSIATSTMQVRPRTNSKMLTLLRYLPTPLYQEATVFRAPTFTETTQIVAPSR